MIHIDDDGQEYKLCARPTCKKEFRRPKGQAPSKFRVKDYCSPGCRVRENKQPVPAKRQAVSEMSGGFVNPEGVWRPAGFPVYPGGIEVVA